MNQIVAITRVNDQQINYYSPEFQYVNEQSMVIAQ